VIVKETGAGISAEAAKLLENAGVAGIDVAGAGGTSWAAVEYHRAKRDKDKLRKRLGEAFWDWGIPTVANIVEAVQSVRIPVIASGGVRSGIDAAKALSLGAGIVSMALPILSPATKGEKETKEELQLVLEELRNTMFLVGAGSVKDMKAVPAVITGETAEWLRTRGFHPEMYAQRKR
jgi:isopentenyl-diphosphate delta-isomerase